MKNMMRHSASFPIRVGKRKKPVLTAAFVLALVIVVLTMPSCGASSQSRDVAWNERFDIPGDTVLGQYLDAMDQLKRAGDEYMQYSMPLQANYSYGIAGASISALRFAVDNLLYMKGQGNSLEEVVEAAYGDWNTIAAISYVSPYPYYFEGMIRQANGESEVAATCYRNALMNPAFPSNVSFLYLAVLNVDELQSLKEILAELEGEIYAVYTPEFTDLPRDPMNFSDAWLRAKGEEALTGEPGDVIAAGMYFAAALRVNPFETRNFTAMALLALNQEDFDSAAYYINEGLWIDPDDEALNALGDAINRAKEQQP